MTKMYGKYHRDHQNSAGWSKSARRRVEFQQELKDCSSPSLTGHVHGQVCGLWGFGCGDDTCWIYLYTELEQDEWDTWTPLSVFETYPLMYTSER